MANDLKADMVLTGGNIITINPAQPRAEAVAVKLTDFAILAADPTAVDPTEIAHIPIDGTIINGELLYKGEPISKRPSLTNLCVRQKF